MQQGFIEIDTLQHDLYILFQHQADRSEQVQHQREYKRNQHDTDDGWQLQKTMIDIAENSRCG